MRATLMDRADGDQIDAILTHPAHQQTLHALIELIRALRTCRSAEDMYHLQGRLRSMVLDTEKRRAAISQQIKRLDKHRKLTADAPELGTALDRTDRESWVLEGDVYERIWRQLKSIADALAWKVFGYQRNIIVALSRADASGPMYGKAGLAAELEVIEDAWRENREFVLHHDLTNVIRVGDVTVLGRDGWAWLREIKTNERYRIPAQERLLAETSQVLADEAGKLPSGHVPVRTTIDYRTDLAGLRDVLGLAHARSGIAGGVVSSGRAVVAASQFTAAGMYTAEEFSTRFSAELDRVRRRIGADDLAHTLTLLSIDQAGRTLVRPPWAIYPIEAEVAASLTADGMFFAVCMNPNKIIDSLAKVGVEASWMQRLDGTENPSKPLLKVAARSGNRLWSTSLNFAAIAELMLELIDLRTWSRQVASMLSGEFPAGTRPWPCFAREAKVWA
ncbi:hypothetical protein FHX75_111403 [Micromonospora palomenae]|uniref:Uncharacterized protein n=1 Tax=Micromonospora palomenae TaxID=1461247 RepID=A0A561WWK8_9ACTN|nr:hypothetical protein [Micromonospora palomenae]TWG28252.1 hypothetical protein FHX75_111403 [Micromonospora palomenae]